LVVTLADGTEVPYLVRPPGSKRDNDWAPIIDQQIDAFEDGESYPAMYTSLMDALAQNEVLSEENERYRQLTNTRDRQCVGVREFLPDEPHEAAPRDPDDSFQDCPKAVRNHRGRGRQERL